MYPIKYWKNIEKIALLHYIMTVKLCKIHNCDYELRYILIFMSNNMIMPDELTDIIIRL